MRKVRVVFFVLVAFVAGLFALTEPGSARPSPAPKLSIPTFPTLITIPSTFITIPPGWLTTTTTASTTTTTTTAPTTTPPTAPPTTPPTMDPHRASVRRLYLAYFLREPEVAGLNYWVGQYDARGLAGISQYFALSSEFKNRYGSLNNGQFVDLIYHNLFARTPEPAGRAYWVGVLNSGRTRGAVMIGFSESPEFVHATTI